MIKTLQLFSSSCTSCGKNGAVIARARRTIENAGYKLEVRGTRFNKMNANKLKEIGLPDPVIYNPENNKATNNLENIDEIL